MSRAATRSNAVTFVVLAVACMMVVSIIGPGGHVLFRDASGPVPRVSAPVPGAHHEETGEDGTDAHQADSMEFGMEALGESFTPVFLPPSGEGRVPSQFVLIHSSAHLPRIYHPPIS